jgi:hypothetical protein
VRQLARHLDRRVGAAVRDEQDLVRPLEPVERLDVAGDDAANVVGLVVDRQDD